MVLRARLRVAETPQGVAYGMATLRLKMASRNDRGATVEMSQVSDQDMWMSTFGVASDCLPWYRGIRFDDGSDWETPGAVTVWMWDKEDESKTVKHYFKTNDIRRAWESMVRGEGSHNGHYYHCGTKITPDCSEDSDQCVGDIVLQIAAYGKLVWG